MFWVMNHLTCRFSAVGSERYHLDPHLQDQTSSNSVQNTKATLCSQFICTQHSLRCNDIEYGKQQLIGNYIWGHITNLSSDQKSITANPRMICRVSLHDTLWAQERAMFNVVQHSRVLFIHSQFCGYEACMSISYWACTVKCSRNIQSRFSFSYSTSSSSSSSPSPLPPIPPHFPA
jgi:hypothetical protein